MLSQNHESMIKSIFYSHFHPDKGLPPPASLRRHELIPPGPQVVFQVPDGSVTSCPDCPASPLFDFDTVSHNIIPKQELCDRLVTVCTNKYRILGYPVCLEDRKYERNEFIFNFAIVLDEDVEYSTYKSVVRKVAKLFKALEEQSGFLSNEVTRSGVYALIEQVMEDLNNYSECMIPISGFLPLPSSSPSRKIEQEELIWRIDESNTINIKLFPTYAPPPPVKPFYVPLCTVQLDNLMDVNWDLTMQKVLSLCPSLSLLPKLIN